MSNSLRLAALAVLWAACVVEEPEKRRFDDDGGQGGAVSAGPSSSISAGGAGPSTSIASSSSTGTTVSTTTTTSTGTGCMNDADEPNDTQATAVDLGIITDCDSELSSKQGVLAGNDTDWYRYYVDEVLTCLYDPYRMITSDGQALLCKFMECVSDPASTEVTCPAGTQAQTAPQGQPGCCGLTTIEPTTNCNDTNVWVRIEKPSAQACVSYTFEYRF